MTEIRILCLKCFNEILKAENPDNVKIYDIELHCDYGLGIKRKCDRCEKEVDCYIYIKSIEQGGDK